jgi:predicted nucleotidyltransferase
MDRFKKALEERKQRQAQTAAAEGMHRTILEELEIIEERENVKILHCIESGSRAWGFASPDSDYDVRFIYVRPIEFYLRLDQARDTIQWQLDDTLDINGWDLQKALALLHKSNPTLFEWNSSPIVYKTTEQWQKIAAVINEYFVAKSGLYHYLSTAKSNYREYLKGDIVRLKKYFYVLRPLLACKWILDKGTPPPMEFHVLMDEYLDEELKPDVEKLLNLKMNTPEITEGKRFDRVNEYLERTMDELDEIIATLPVGQAQSWNKLNKLFLEILKNPLE